MTKREGSRFKMTMEEDPRLTSSQQIYSSNLQVYVVQLPLKKTWKLAGDT